ncbi:hypothetical protein [Roseimarinus sediminis]|uniref:hypothetical protein n=1 Tax=Roseimarinus sediminis TaxID=1610899 RepID=UPI003D211A73
MQHRRIIEELKNIDLNEVPIEYIKEKLIEFGKFGVMTTTLHAGKRIIRVRPSENTSFKTISELSYKPQILNTTYQRASTPNMTMFYGAIVPEILGKSEPTTARITTLYEVSNFVRDSETMGEKKFTFSAWDVIEDVTLISLIHHKNFERPTKLSIELQQKYKELTVMNPDFKIPSIEISSFLANEFAKDVKTDSDYKISAAYAEISSEKYDGVLYPSMRLAGEGINIAIKPESVDNKLTFVGAVECTVYKNKKNVYLGNNSKARLLENGKLEFYSIDGTDAVRNEFGRKLVGLK